jgi:hydroxypyruvate isomerase
MHSTRRQFLSTAVASPLVLAASAAESEPTDALPPPKYHLAINLEIMFPREMPYEERIEQAARCGAKAYGFWGWRNKNLDKMLDAQHKHGLRCVSVSGNPKTGWNTGLTKTGYEQAFLEDFEEVCQVAKRFGAENLITFVGERQKEIPWETQRAQIIAGLKKAGRVAQQYGVYLTLEPLNRVESPQMTMLTAREAFDFAAEADHPHVKVDYDMYHRQLGEGNILNNLEEGLKKRTIRFLEIGDVPGRKEPGSGETNYVNIFRFLRRVGYAGDIGMEHGTTRTPQYAWDTVRKMAGL